MATVTGTLTALDQISTAISVAAGDSLQVVITGDFIGTMVMQQSQGGGAAWSDAGTYGVGTDALSGPGIFRLRCSRYISGTATYTLTTLAAPVLISNLKRVTTIDADVTGVNGTALQNIFPAAQDVFTTAGDTTYEFELFLSGTNGATTCSKALALAGSAVISSIRYWALGQSVAINSAGATQSSGHYDTAASTIVLASGTSSWWIVAKGILRTAAGGTIIPQLQLSADPTGTILFKQNSYMWLQPVGVGAMGAVGAWG